MRKFWMFVSMRVAGAVLALGFAGPARAQSASTPAPTAYDATTVDQFLTACRADQNSCMNEIGNAYLKGAYESDASICLSSLNYGAPVPGWLTSHPETHTMPVNDGIFLALRNLYSCKDG